MSGPNAKGEIILPPGMSFLAGGGAATQLILARDWTEHPLGPPETWPEALKTALSLILNSPESMILSWGKEDLWFFFNETYFPLLGPRLEWAMGAPFVQVWADAWAQAKPIIDDAFAGASQRFVNLPWKLATDRGSEDTWWTFSYSRILDAEGDIAGLFIFTNETTSTVLANGARDDAEERRGVVIEESKHRLKNTLAMVQAIATQTLQGVDRQLVTTFQDRLLALATAHDTLTQQDWQKADLEDLIHRTLRNVCEEQQFKLSGPHVWVSDRAAQSITLLIHEMATNALKHGALSSPTGQLRLSWAVEHGEVVLHWAEIGGPPAYAPKRRGFGSRLIAMGLAGKGGSDLRYEPEGLHATFTAPLHLLAAS